jgi:hypothetical protein
MGNPHILHMITPLKHMSPFDVNMALDAGFDAAIPYTNVTIEDVAGLVQDAIFSRGPDGVKPRKRSNRSSRPDLRASAWRCSAERGLSPSRQP